MAPEGNKYDVLNECLVSIIVEFDYSYILFRVLTIYKLKI